MSQFFLNKRLMILLVSIIILVGLIGFSMKDRGKATWPEQFMQDSVGWVQSVFHKPAGAVAGFFTNVGQLKNTFQENKVLKARLDEYVMLSENVKELEKENQALRDLLNKQESLRDFTVIQGTVIARNPDNWHKVVMINKGAKQGVQKNMAVITSEGIVGKIKQVSPFHSTVQLLSDIERTNRVSAILRGKEEVFGLIEGYDQKNDVLLFKRIPFDKPVEKGQAVITSGLGGIFPKGLVIGKVVKVIPDEYGLTQTAYVKPAANFYDISHIMVVKRTIQTLQQSSPQVGGQKK